MRYIFFILFLYASALSFGQKITVIDKSKKTAVLFDEENPHSYLSLLNFWRNTQYLGYFEFEGISNQDMGKLTPEQRSSLKKFLGEQSNVPLIDEDINSPTYGEPIIEYDEATDQYSFVYPPVDTTYTDFNGISRIVLEYGSNDGVETEIIKSVTFCKKYNGDFVPVFKTSYSSILSVNGFQYMSKVPDTGADILNDSENKMSFWNLFRDSVSRVSDVYYLDYKWLPSPPYVEWIDQYDHRPDAVEDNREADGFSLIYPMDNGAPSLPFDYKLYDLVGGYSSNPEKIEHLFDTVLYEVFENDVPIIDSDPDSPNFGEYLIVTDSLGQLNLLYPPADTIIYWLEFQPIYFVMNSLVEENGILKSVPERLLMVLSDADGVHLAGSMYLAPFWRDLVQPNLVDFDWQNWKKSFDKAMTKGKNYNLSDPKQKSKFDMSARYWQ